MEEELDEFIDRLPRGLQNKVLPYVNGTPVEAEPTKQEALPKVPHLGLKFLGCFIFGTAMLLLGIVLFVATAGMLLPLTLICWLIAGAPLAGLIAQCYQVGASRDREVI